MSTKSKVAIIGTGNIGSAVAANLVKGDRPVIVANHHPEKAQALAQQLGSDTKAMDISAAIKDADIIVLAIYFDAIKAFLTQYAFPSLKEKLLLTHPTLLPLLKMVVSKKSLVRLNLPASFYPSNFQKE